MMIKLPITSPYTAKDQVKADHCTCFIGRGSAQSSTHAYSLAFGEHANRGSYDSADVVFISAEGNRVGRIKFDWHEVRTAARAGVTFITDTPYHRNRAYNIGEREVAEYLNAIGYYERREGIWQRR